jgi:glycosyltransferase involved in cell wall biosynthesis
MSPAPHASLAAASAMALRSSANDEGAASLRVSIVISTSRRPQRLALCLGAVIGQRFAADAFEIIVVDDGHGEETRAVVEALAPRGGAPTVRYLRTAGEHGHGELAAREQGWRSAHAPLIAFVDDMAHPDPEWLARGVDTAAAERLPVALGSGACTGSLRSLFADGFVLRDMLERSGTRPG